MIYEYRVYEAMPGRMPDLQRRFREHTVRIFQKHQMTPIAFFTSEIGGSSDQLSYILAFQDLDHREKAWAAFLADPEWKQVYTESNSHGQIVARVRNQIMRPTDYSPLS
jgi:NIPSNAP